MNNKMPQGLGTGQLFEKNFEANKTNVAWLKKAASRLAGKDCDDDPLFVKLLE
jgi:hypothetical protein